MSDSLLPPSPLTVDSSDAATSVARRILVIESEPESADALAELLENDGFEVKIAVNAQNALILLDDFEPQLVLLGTYLADMPGYELTAILRGAPQYSAFLKHVGLLFIADRHKMIRTRFIGAPEVPIAQYIFKPVEPAEVREKVARELARIGGEEGKKVSG